MPVRPGAVGTPVRVTRWVDSAPPVALLSASSRTVVGARPITSASVERTITEGSKSGTINDIAGSLSGW